MLQQTALGQHRVPKQCYIIFIAKTSCLSGFFFCGGDRGPFTCLTFDQDTLNLVFLCFVVKGEIANHLVGDNETHLRTRNKNMLFLQFVSSKAAIFMQILYSSFKLTSVWLKNLFNSQLICSEKSFLNQTIFYLLLLYLEAGSCQYGRCDEGLLIQLRSLFWFVKGFR